ncbi:hypothetical protein POTOM_043059 [Populus tomentosa]|uniref:B box-type domain-containing protein n=1 Tax=Populus tomentosa TaxID=118781 RepID=A0A8X7YNC3_POPTO|nr:hypothetical protein POTOM_043059 [Populus tomentosa]
MLDWFNNFISIHEIDEEGAHLQIKQKIMSVKKKLTSTKLEQQPITINLHDIFFFFFLFNQTREEIDYAKPCLSCDQHVHSTNLLLRKHVRSQICDNCNSELVSVRCVNDNLILCQECDWDVHGTYFMVVPQLLIWLPYGVSGAVD